MSWCFRDLDNRVRVSLFRFAINAKVELTLNKLENKSRIKNNCDEFERLFKKRNWGTNSIGTGAKCCIYQKYQ